MVRPILDLMNEVADDSGLAGFLPYVVGSEISFAALLGYGLEWRGNARVQAAEEQGEQDAAYRATEDPKMLFRKPERLSQSFTPRLQGTQVEEAESDDKYCQEGEQVAVESRLTGLHSY
eukprot:TRINITY_DN45821_c0_g1_i1.p2 TRINITY_DN45821_c0_g1~~TRINITY_DN45821_c0_g1_i1.p2  ORF type:complete len:119 (-),score=21.90 TRINITY_DN45821_c0_g1_i1:89-445(-)